ncbi:cytochrome c [Caballeronia ptereochthonis]|uniref:Cytochrome c, class I n=1 Tax=Caballeronia ptereochthonis TaxID=1777144 RepID=A0A157ZET9_9BURK|nr:cytochrome c [Caballeronia ptereochthonis]SAK44061.1 cytochrome c, class I [Caballeronia ptereochthonis]
MGLKHALALASLMLACASSMAASLVINVGGDRSLTTEQLLARPDVATIRVPNDVTFRGTMTYRAVPLRALLAITQLPADKELQITAADGFVTHLPSNLLFGDGKKRAEPWLAIESPDEPWPRVPGSGDIGPFYVVWIDPALSGVTNEQWPFKVDAIRIAPTLTARWPQIAADQSVPAASPVRRGQTVFATQCMVCHKMNGAGDASMGPDLNLPHNPTEYFQPWVLKSFIRNPRSIRAWQDMKMPGFDRNAISDTDVDAVIAYLGYMAKRRK